MSIYDDDWGDPVATPRRISLEEQEQTGLVPRTNKNTFVRATPQQPHLPAQTNYGVSLDVTPSAQQAVIVRTSAVDRAKGFSIALTPLAIILGVLAVLISLFFDATFFSLATLLIFWLSFALTWVVGWVVTLIITPEFVSLYEARRKWNIVENEQRERWAHYRWQQGRDE